MRGSLEVTKITGLSAVPVTRMPVTSRSLTSVFSVPSSSWFAICWIEVIVSTLTTS
jgi:hypothetical protein